MVLKDCKGGGGVTRNMRFGTLAGGDSMDKEGLVVGAAAVEEGGLSSDDAENVLGAGKVESVPRRQRGGGGGGMNFWWRKEFLFLSF